MPDIQTAQNWQGQVMTDASGSKIGKITDIYVDKETGQPEWALVNTGLFGTKGTFVPLAEVRQEGNDIRAPYDKDMVKDAPGIDPDGELSEAQEGELYSYYGMQYSSAPSDTGLPVGTTDTGTVGRDTSGPTTDRAMTRSEEELAVTKGQREAGRARLRKWIETEQVQTTVPVQREQLRVEREPITEANIGDATSGPDLSEEEHEVVLTEETVDVSKRVVPKERVRLDKETVVENREVSEQVQKERIDIDEGTTRGGVDDTRR